MKNYFDEHLSKRMVWALIFSVLFMSLGRLIPDVYFQYFDNTPYYTIVQPIPVDKKYYKPCENVQITATRTSQVNTTIDAFIELVLRKDNTAILKVPGSQIHRSSIITRSERQTVLISYPLPCNISEGVYYWQILVKYKVHGYGKEYAAVTDTFNVNQWGADPDVIKIATESAKLDMTPTQIIRRINQSIQNVPVPTPYPTAIVQENTPQSQTVINNNTTVNQPEEKKNPQSNPTPEQNDSSVEDIIDNIKSLL